MPDVHFEIYKRAANGEVCIEVIFYADADRRTLPGSKISDITGAYYNAYLSHTYGSYCAYVGAPNLIERLFHMTWEDKIRSAESRLRLKALKHLHKECAATIACIRALRATRERPETEGGTE